MVYYKVLLQVPRSKPLAPRRVILKLYRSKEFRKLFSPFVFVCFCCFSFFLSCSFVLGAFFRPRAESQFVVRHSLALLRASLCKCLHFDLWIVTSNAFLGFPTAWEQPSRTKRGLLESLSRSGTFAWTGNCPLNWELANFHNAIRSTQLDRFSFLARCNLNKLPSFGNGNIKWGPVKKVIANTHFSVFNVKSLNKLRRLRQKHFNSSTNLCPFSDKGVIYVIYSVNNSRMLHVGQTCESTFERF